jgi:hypothetical protein
MLGASLTEVRTVTLEGIKSQWKISKREDVALIDDIPYVRLAPSSYSLNHLVASNNETMQPHQKVSASKGLAHLVSLRNQQQAQDLSTVGQCSLFGKVKKAKVTHRYEQEAKRKTPETMTLEIGVDGVCHHVSVLRPIHPTDNLFVAYDADMLKAVLHVIRTSGFDEPERRCRGDIPKGILTNKKGFIVKHLKPDGSNGYKFHEKLEDAKAFQADPQPGHHDADPEPIQNDDNSVDDNAEQTQA